MQHSHEKRLPELPHGLEWLPVRSGESGDSVYRRSDGAAYAKFAEGARGRLLEEERRRTEWLASTGIACPAVLDWTLSEDGACLVTRALPGVPASTLSGSELKRAWSSIVRQIRAFHALPAAECPFERGLAMMFGCAEDVVTRGAVNPAFLAPSDRQIPPMTLLERLREELPVRLTQERGDIVVCHGDACLPNFLVAPETLVCTGVIDLGRLGRADRYVDFSLLLGSAGETWRSHEEAQAAYDDLFKIHAGVEPDPERLDFYLRLDPLTWG